MCSSFVNHMYIYRKDFLSQDVLVEGCFNYAVEGNFGQNVIGNVVECNQGYKMKKGTTNAADGTPIAPTPYFLSHPYGSPDNRTAPQVSRDSRVGPTHVLPNQPTINH